MPCLSCSISYLLLALALTRATATLATTPAPLRQAYHVGSLAQRLATEATDTTNGIRTLTERLAKNRH